MYTQIIGKLSEFTIETLSDLHKTRVGDEEIQEIFGLGLNPILELTISNDLVMAKLSLDKTKESRKMVRKLIRRALEKQNK